MSDSPLFSEFLISKKETIRRLRETGRISSARWCPSPNFNRRPPGFEPTLLVIHNISLPPGHFSGDAIERFFCNELSPDAHPYFRSIADLQVSSHLLIRRDGTLLQFVSFHDRAWHAGRSSFRGEDECNDFSIGVELEGSDEILFTKAQYDQLVKVADSVMAAWPTITPDRITGHSDIAPGRKTDPGPAFDWPGFLERLADARREGEKR